ncbi:hypothetical protein [Sinisalibacter aestuarii]|uniref:Uncharacterized protein n=1 Tax=Sinisalibacter aestuarii TaxID=2949426 RepID=A0ABQ5LQT4_9RHOB|nr:hypothetical protein [Sinisalibacter aestuarii]GKY86770.1 hypothetical protein STA1M1_06390 [Sinisalibacter aestuarii]
MRRIILATVLISLASAANAQDCSRPGYVQSMALLAEHFTANQIDLFNVQLQFNAMAGYRELVPDGRWGPASAAKVCHALETWGAINGADPDTLMHTPAEAANFVAWMGAMARANLVPNVEVPD